jgi:carbon-monoxide dehydrogenase medium subunit
MIPPAFEYLRPKTIPEAIALLEQHGDEAKIMSGGQSLIPMMKLRLARPGFLIDINRIPNLNYVKEDEGFLKIGALAREADLDKSALIKTKYPILRDTVAVIADPQVRNLATLAGNLAHGDPANDHPATMLALGASIVATGPNGERIVPVSEFFLSLFSTLLEPNEVLTEVRIPIPPAGSGGAYLKVERKVSDFATAAVAAQLTLDSFGSVTYAGIGVTNVGPKPLKAKRAEEFLIGKKPDDVTFRQAAQLASDDSEPSADLRGPAEYKRGLVKELTRRALALAAQRASHRESQ